VQTVTSLADGLAEDTTRVIHGAISRREPIVARYKGHRLILCPHVLGWRQGDRHVLALLVNTTPPFQWAWIPLGEIKHAAVGDGPWFTTPPASWPSLDYLEATDVAAEPLVRSQTASGPVSTRKLLTAQGERRLGIALGVPPDRNGSA